MQIGSQHSFFFFEFLNRTKYLTLMIGNRYIQVRRWTPDFSSQITFLGNKMGFRSFSYEKKEYGAPVPNFYNQKPLIKKPIDLNYFGYNKLFGYYCISTWKKKLCEDIMFDDAQEEI